MNAVGKLGSYISKSVYTVSGPFHPFGGAVDIIVVEQPDGSFKSSPWYVKFGKFQGVLKTKEKVVQINVNGMDADFSMYLDHKGEAYFLEEVEIEEGETLFSPPSSSGDDTDGQSQNRRPIKSNSWNCEADFSASVTEVDVSNGNVVATTKSKRSRILGLMFGRKSMRGNKSSGEENGTRVIRAESLERAEIAADLLEMKWSTNLVPDRHEKGNASQSSAQNTSNEDTNAGLKINDGQSNEYVLSHNDGNLDCKKHKEAGSPGFEVDNSSLFSTQKPENSAGTFSCNGSTNDDASDSSVKSEKSDANHFNEEDGNDRIQSLVCCDTSKTQLLISDESSQQNDRISCLSCESSGELCVHPEVLHITPDSPSEVKSKAQNETSREPFDVPECLAEKNNVFFDKELESDRSFPNSPTKSSFTESSSQVVTFPTSTCFHEGVEARSAFNISSSSNLTADVQEDVSVSKEVGNSQKTGGKSALLNILGSEISEEEQLLFGDLDGLTLGEVKNLMLVSQKVEEVDISLSPYKHESVRETSLPKYEMNSEWKSPPLKHMRSYSSGRRIDLETTSSDANIPINNEIQTKEVTRMARSLPNIWSLNSRNADELGRPLERCTDSSSKLSKRVLLPPSIRGRVKSGPNDINKFTHAQQLTQDSKIIAEPQNRDTNKAGGDPSNSNDAAGGSWKMWPFPSNRSGNSEPDLNCSRSSDAEKIIQSGGGMDEKIDLPIINIVKKKMRRLTPTSDQLATLNLKEGGNPVTFTFSTSVLGKQQVDARIYLWRWDANIVISDVDGTITRSDVLGQFMPLVGVDWSQTGVAHLFSAIKENGYQLLFLSARAISQAYITRQFLFNLKQDGKTLPDGPVVISPDGLFPSLFREVVRRAPHEFKIACLEDIKALFPSDRSPFYAGFGNRDTDELSYLKVGIPKGKIFIINPKGEVVVNRHIDTKSYTSLHALVNGMFPPTSLSEQEDFNSWNFWKLPPPSIHI